MQIKKPVPSNPNKNMAQASERARTSMPANATSTPTARPSFLKPKTPIAQRPSAGISKPAMPKTAMPANRTLAPKAPRAVTPLPTMRNDVGTASRPKPNVSKEQFQAANTLANKKRK